MEKLDFTKNVEIENTPGSISKIIVSIVEANKTAVAYESTKEQQPLKQEATQQSDTTAKQPELDISPKGSEDKKETYDPTFASTKTDDIESSGATLNPESIIVKAPSIEEPIQASQDVSVDDSVEPKNPDQKIPAVETTTEQPDQQNLESKKDDADQDAIFSKILQEVEKIQSFLLSKDSTIDQVSQPEVSSDALTVETQLEKDQQQENKENVKFEKLEKDQIKIFNNIYQEVQKIQKSFEKDRIAAEEAEREAQATREKDVELKQEQKTEDEKQGGFFENLFGAQGFSGLFNLLKNLGSGIFNFSKNIMSFIPKLIPAAGKALTAAGGAISSGVGAATSFLTGGLGVTGLMTSSAGAALSGGLGAGAAIGAGASVVGAAVGGFYAGDYIAEKAGVGIYGWAKDAEKQGEQAAKAAEAEPDELKKTQLELIALENQAQAERTRSLGGIGGWFRKEGVASEETLKQIEEKRKKMNELYAERKKNEEQLKSYRKSMGLEEPTASLESTNEMQTVSVGEPTSSMGQPTQPTTISSPNDGVNTYGMENQNLNTQPEYEAVTVGDNATLEIQSIPTQIESAKATNEAQTSASMTVNEAMRLANIQTSQKASASPIVNQVTVNNSSQSYSAGGEFRRPIEPEVGKRRT